MSVVTTNQSKTMGQRVLQMFSDVLNAVSEELENIPRPTVRVFSVTGSTVTATLGVITLTTAEESKCAWEFKLPRYGAWKITSTTPTGDTYSEVVDVDDVKKYFVQLGIEVKRYGYRIREAEPDPYARVEYILDAVGMTPAHMDFENEVFEYGSWQNVWFVADNKPLMLKYDGTVDYYLDPNDYTLREDGETASDVANVNYEGNAMAQFPLCWIYRYEDDTYKYEIVCNVKWDENYKAYAHTRADGAIADYFYYSLFDGAKIDGKMRSLSNQTISHTLTGLEQLTTAQANGSGYCLHTWSQRECIRTLCVMIGKSTNAQEVFGMGLTDARELETGVWYNKGAFFGSSTTTKGVKIFHIENYYGNTWDRFVGLLNNSGTILAKMTPEGEGYSFSGSDYEQTGIKITARMTGYVSSVRAGQYGLLPTTLRGSLTTYYTDGIWIVITKLMAGMGGGRSGVDDGYIGIFALSLDVPYTTTHANYTCGISYV